MPTNKYLNSFPAYAEKNNFTFKPNFDITSNTTTDNASFNETRSSTNEPKTINSSDQNQN